MISRLPFDPVESESDSEPWITSLTQANLLAASIAEAFDQARQHADQMALSWEKAKTVLAAVTPASPLPAVGGPLSNPTSDLPGADARTIQANTPTLNPPADASGPTPPPPSPSDLTPASPPPPQPQNNPSPANSSAPDPESNHAATSIPADAIHTAAQLAQSAQQLQLHQSDAATLRESLSTALDLMNEIAAQAASHSEVAQLASGLETLRQKVNDLSSRASANRSY